MGSPISMCQSLPINAVSVDLAGNPKATAAAVASAFNAVEYEYERLLTSSAISVILVCRSFLPRKHVIAGIQRAVRRGQCGAWVCSVADTWSSRDMHLILKQNHGS